MIVLLLPFQFGLFISSFCLIAVARTSSTMFNKCVESEHPCLVPDLKGTVCGFYPVSMILAVGLSYMTFIMLIYVPSIPTLLKVFNMSSGFYHLLFLHLLI